MPTGFQHRSYHDDDGVEHGYSVFIPEAYNSATRWPAIFFMHGAGERGTNNRSQLEVGLAPVVRRQAESFPAIVFFPQARLDWSKDRADLNRAVAEFARVEQEFSIDPDRVYVTGISMGGHGTWDAVHLCPGRFAAAVPICGFFDRDIEPMLKLPMWFFHGADDSVVPVHHSRDAVAALRSAGAVVRYTEYHEVDHDSWVRAYDAPELFEWMFKQRRGG